MNLKWGLGIYDGQFLYLELLCNFPLPVNRIWNCYVIPYLANTVELHENKMIAFKKKEDYILISILFNTCITGFFLSWNWIFLPAVL